ADNSVSSGVTRVGGVVVNGWDVVGSISSSAIGRTEWHTAPSLSIDWHIGRRLFAYFRIAQGKRAGGLSVVSSGATFTAQKFRTDRLLSRELGLRFGQQDKDRFWFSSAVSYATWHNVQADLIEENGLPYTTNIGDGYIYGLEARGGWTPFHDLDVTAAMFLNKSTLSAPAAAFINDEGNTLPNVAKAGAYGELSYTLAFNAHTSLTLNGAVRYVGPSRLGVGSLFDSTQGNYVSSAAGIRLARHKLGFSLNIDNIANVRANQFAFGNPFGISIENQVTPLRPRTIRFGIDGAF
ncbi:MAG: hypothetical protein KGJ05_08225, partial [Alphaproteobacteria bacterium]|nr:hypothetical protein [Alphaproteobacteria bacterium]